MKSVSRNAALSLGVAILVFSGGLAQAQLPIVVTQVKANIEDAEVAMQNTPEYEAGNVKEKRSPRTREWLEIEVPFEFTESDSKIGIIPEISLRFYVAVVGAGNQGYILTDTFNYTNIPDDGANFAVVYVSPSSLARIAGGFGEFDEGDVKAWGVELLFNGAISGVASSGGRDWWNSAGGTRLPGFLMPKEKTPFNNLWVDRHVELKQQQN